jgi:hypothetical protein
MDFLSTFSYKLFISTKYCKKCLITHRVIAALQKYDKKYLSGVVTKFKSEENFGCNHGDRSELITAALYEMNITYQFAELPYA